MTFKIELYNAGRKDKHKLYDSEQAYLRWWEYRKKDVNYYARLGLQQGIVGYVDGAVERTYGAVPEDKRLVSLTGKTDLS